MCGLYVVHPCKPHSKPVPNPEATRYAAKSASEMVSRSRCMGVCLCVWSFTCFNPSGTHTAVGKYQNQTSLATQRNQHRRWCREVGPRVCMCLCVYVRVLAVRCSAPGTASWEPSQIWRLCPRQLSLSISIYISISHFLHYYTTRHPHHLL